MKNGNTLIPIIIHQQLVVRCCSKAVYKPVWHIPLLSVQWINSWGWTEELSETCRFSCQNKFVKLVHLVGFIIKKNLCLNSLNKRWCIHTNTCISSWYKLVIRWTLADECSLGINTSSVKTGLRAFTLINICAVAWEKRQEISVTATVTSCWHLKYEEAERDECDV
jgi:hypothetical protein